MLWRGGTWAEGASPRHFTRLNSNAQRAVTTSENMHPWRTYALWLALMLATLACARRETQLKSEPDDTGDAAQQPSDASSQQRWDVPDVSFVYDGPVDNGLLNPDAACAVMPVAAEPVALDLYLMLDRSASMAAPLDTVPNCKVGDTTEARWCYAINALAGFFKAPTSNGMGVALNFFPHGTCTTISDCCASGDCCTGTDDATPEVPLGRLPGQIPSLVNALNAQSPLGVTTPMEAALRGLVAYTAAAKSSDRSMVAILVTDGEPNGCEKDVTKLSSIVSNHLAATGIKTFIIGTDDANFATLEQLAEAGGATPHSIYCAAGFSTCSFFNVGAGQPEAFIDALQQIQRSVVGCRFSLPTTDAGIVDPSTLQVNVVSPANPDRQILQHRAIAADCGDGWYADPDHPGEFVLCPNSCSTVQAQVGVSIELLAGCLGA